MSVQTPGWIRWKTTLLSLGAALWFPLPAMAADSGGWRATYDVVMMWVNFVILVALLVKFLRKPLMQFLTSQRDAIQKTYDELETEKSRLADDVQAMRKNLEARRQQARERHQRILQRARMERREIIEDAREEAERRLTKARQLVDTRHREAWQSLRNEIVDAAVAKAMAELPRQVTPEGQKAWVNLFLKSISRSPS